MTSISSSSEPLMSFALKSDSVALIQAKGFPGKEVSVTDGLAFLQSTIPQIEAFMNASSNGRNDTNSVKFGRWLVNITNGSSNRTALMYRPEQRDKIRLELNYSSGAPHPLYTHYIEKIIRAVGLEAFKRFMSNRFGGDFEPEKRVLVFNNAMYPNICCSFLMNKLPNTPGSVDPVWGIGNSPYYFATPINSQTLWASQVTEAQTVPNKFLIPLTNFFNEGRMCFGSISRFDKFTDNGNYRPLDWFIDVLCTSNYNLDLLSSHTVRAAESLTSDQRLFSRYIREDFPNFEWLDSDRRCIDGNYTYYLDWISYLTTPTLTTYPYHLFV